MSKNNITIMTFVLFFIAATLTVLDGYGLVPIDHSALFISRWLAIASLFYYGIQRKSLTAWIMISMAIGAEIGNDFPETAVNLRIFSKIFLQLIKTIIAPLLFSTLVVGIAGHSNLKQVGR